MVSLKASGVSKLGECPAVGNLMTSDPGMYVETSRIRSGVNRASCSLVIIKVGDLAPVIPPFMSRICSGYGPDRTGL